MARSPESRDRSMSRSRSPVDDAQTDSPRKENPDAIVFDWKNKLLDILEDNRIPKSDLSDTTWEQLEEIGTTLACNVVQRLSESNLDRIRNFNNFTLSIMKRIKDEGPDLAKGDIRNLAPKVEDAVRDLCADGKVYVEDFDQRIVSALNGLSTELALQAVEKFASSNFESVRSKTGFMMSIIRRINDEAEGRTHGPSRGGGGRHDRYNDRYDRGDRYDRYDRYDRGHDRYDRYDRYDRGYERERYGGRPYDRYDRGDRYDRYDRGYDRDYDRYDRYRR